MFKRNLYYSDGKKVPPFWIFIAPIAIFFVCIPYLAKKNLPLMFAILASLAIILIFASLGFLYVGLRIDRYVQKHDFQLWKKSKSHSFKDRREAGKAMTAMSMRTPCLEKHVRYANKVAFILLTIWTLISLGIFSFMILSAV